MSIEYRIHVDAAFGGFIYPLTMPTNRLSFAHPKVCSVTMDAHKMLQAPYGTGIFLARKGYMQSVCTNEAQYVRGKDYTLCGSRSGANAVSVYMILMSYGSEDARTFCRDLVERTDRFCESLERLSVRHFREQAMNVVALRANDVPASLAAGYGLVPDVHTTSPNWWKIVVMDHVKDDVLSEFVGNLSAARNT
jgi:glutamate/tyrosine decarboxylase-like PLP-dependent enzyme